MSRGVDVNATDILGNTALDYAIQYNKLQLNLLLSASGGRMNLQDSTLPKLKQNINDLIDMKIYPISKAQGLLNILTNLMPSEQELAKEIREELLLKFAPIIDDAIPSIIKQSTHSIDNISTTDKDNLIKFQTLCLNLDASNISALDHFPPRFWESLRQAFAQTQNLLSTIDRLKDSAPSVVDLMETDTDILTSNSLPLNTTSEHETVGTTGDVEMDMEVAQLR